MAISGARQEGEGEGDLRATSVHGNNNNHFCLLLVLLLEEKDVSHTHEDDDERRRDSLFSSPEIRARIIVVLVVEREKNCSFSLKIDYYIGSSRLIFRLM